MNAPSRIANAQLALPVVDILKILAESGASSWSLHPLELADVVDCLQWFAEQTGLVAALGQDRVQQLISAPFARIRAGTQR
jgi:hypothetical protein